ncbi:MAG: hypothetical protein IJM59_12135 [Proteobacteria bacterium]|nr:hypothetical protein [Pseudomonadota bacterium]
MKRRKLILALVIFAIITMLTSAFAYIQWQRYENAFENDIQGPLGHRKAAHKKLTHSE